MQPRGQPRHLRLGQVTCDGAHQSVAPRPVAPARLAQVPVVGASLDQPRQRELVEGRGAVVGEVALLGQALDQVRRQDEPAEADGGRERLARRAHVDHAVGRQAL